MNAIKMGHAASPTKPRLDEKHLVELAKAGDARAFGKLYDASVDRVYRFLFFRVNDVQTAEDLTSLVFLKAWENLHRYEPRGPFLAWLYSIARNTVIDHYRTHKQTVSLDEAAPMAAPNAKPDDLVEIRALLEKYELAPDRIVLMPQAQDRDTLLDRSRWLVDICKSEGYLFSTRLQIILWGNRRGV